RYRSAQTLGGGVDVDHLLAIEVPAALGVHLVLDVRPGDTRVFQRLDRARDVHRLPEAGIGIDDRRQVRHLGDLARTPRHLCEGGEADVGEAEFGAHHCTGHVHPVETETFDHLRCERVERPGELEEALTFERLAQVHPARGCVHVCAEHQKSPLGRSIASSSPGFARTFRLRTPSASSSGRRATMVRNRSISSGVATSSARVWNLFTYCSRANGRAPKGWASATAISSVITRPSLSVISTRPPKAFSFGSGEW